MTMNANSSTNYLSDPMGS